MNFPVGGPRQPVYDYLAGLGLVMSEQGDKRWVRADGVEVNVYGAGSRAVVTGPDLVADIPLGEVAGLLAMVWTD